MGICPYHCTHTQDCEQRLLLECGKCPAQRALVLAATALVQPDGSRQLALLEVG